MTWLDIFSQKREKKDFESARDIKRPFCHFEVPCIQRLRLCAFENALIYFHHVSIACCVSSTFRGQRSLHVLSERMNHTRGSKEINRTLRPGVHRNSPLEGKPPDRTRYSLGILDKTKLFFYY